MIRIGLILFPGSNCERETGLALKRAGMDPIEFLWNEPSHKLKNMDGYVLVGGFSYEDRSRAGIIAALDPVMQEIRMQSLAGKPILGICNGAQILVESGLVPGLSQAKMTIALTDNKRLLDGKIQGRGFYNNWINIRLSNNFRSNAFSRHLTVNDVLSLPVAHAEGRFIMPPEMLHIVEQEGLNLFQYCDNQGKIWDYFPVNPNGSMGNIAAIANQAGNVLAMMPHPERTPRGDAIFTSMRDYILEENKLKQAIPSFDSYPVTPQPFKQSLKNHEHFVKSIITDNHALTVEKTLKKLGIAVSVKRFKHWEIACNSIKIIDEAKKTGVLYCERKEREVLPTELQGQQTLSCLVRPKEDLIGQQTLQILRSHYAYREIEQIKFGILWQFKSETKKDNYHELMDKILSTNIVGNPYAHECYQYSPLS
jgi:phosphoribosylformylglycinamidine synthase I